MSESPAPAKRPIIIAVAGGTGSGKTTVSAAIRERVGGQNLTYLPHDVYYHNLDKIPTSSRGVRNFDHPDAWETPLMIEHLQRLQNWHEAEIPIYDFVHHSRLVETQRVKPHPVILVEGILVLAEPALRDLFDVKIFVDADADIRFIRRLRRDMAERGRTLDSVIEQYMDTVRPMHLEFVEPSKRYADVIIPRGGHNLVAIDMVTDRIRSLLTV
ncbi:MAG: uridine kinase [Burkholderiales bacterium]|nr:uridine kinase [Anaerolineae bacterium]